MTREEIKNTPELVDYLLDESVIADSRKKLNKRIDEICNLAIQALEQEPKTEQFAKWVATEIFDELWEYNKDSFEEIACRKLAKLGIVRAKGDKWELVDQQESEG